MPMVLSVAPLHSLGHNDQTEVKHDVFSHLIPLVPTLLSFDTKCTVGISVSITWNWWYFQWHHFVSKVKMIETRYSMTSSWGDTGDIISNTTTFVSSRWSNQDENWPLQSFHTWHQHQHHVGLMAISTIPCIHQAKMTQTMCNIKFVVM